MLFRIMEITSAPVAGWCAKFADGAREPVIAWALVEAASDDSAYKMLAGIVPDDDGTAIANDCEGFVEYERKTTVDLIDELRAERS